MTFQAYLLRCADGRYYVGHTDDLDRRVAEHNSGLIPGYTQIRRPVALVWTENFPDREQAFAVERQIKGWSRAKKEALIAGDFGALRDLAKRRVLRDATSPSSVAPQDERVGDSLSALPEEGLSLGEGPSRGTPAIVLVRPQLAENIGKAARAMLNFGLTDLRLVTPRDGWPNPQAGPAASGADSVIANARVYESVAEAVADRAHVFATTVRKRGVTKPVVTPEQAASLVHTEPGGSAILFGPERSGLETDDVALARTIITVPINPEFGSLNLAQAVILVAYEWSKGENLASPPSVDIDPPAPQGELEGMLAQLDVMLEDSGFFFPPSRVATVKRTLRTMLTKPAWNSQEVRTMRGVLSALDRPRPRRGETAQD
ncbi:TrmH family RNA methyltransferase [Sphingomonas sp. BIUV-7]|uniref:TrmH family RNA methyltransferase n=1 Tax=Sphingomonas natans TaxID=3063330 RepID=A0ABT8YAX1_9SPHN|nr:TrmH family RNA methyltransferase [Sphingomonas sp. BIUV-7]MDO6415481.1 TrmH family RNA methyltransferase [Sphingomonas sp. BIUV-7]